MLKPERQRWQRTLEPYQAALGRRAAAALSHPSIVTIYDVGEADGLLYIAMEFLERDLKPENKAPYFPFTQEAVQTILPKSRKPAN